MNPTVAVMSIMVAVVMGAKALKSESACSARGTFRSVILRYYYGTSGTPEVCQLPAGMAENNKLVLYQVSSSVTKTKY